MWWSLFLFKKKRYFLEDLDAYLAVLSGGIKTDKSRYFQTNETRFLHVGFFPFFQDFAFSSSFPIEGKVGNANPERETSNAP